MSGIKKTNAAPTKRPSTTQIIGRPTCMKASSNNNGILICPFYIHSLKRLFYLNHLKNNYLI